MPKWDSEILSEKTLLEKEPQLLVWYKVAKNIQFIKKFKICKEKWSIMKIFHHIDSVNQETNFYIKEPNAYARIKIYNE